MTEILSDQTTNVAPSIQVPAEPNPWEGERLIEGGRISDNPEFLMGHPHSLDDHSLINSSAGSQGIWDDEIVALEKQVHTKLEQAEEGREKIGILKSKKLRRQTYIHGLMHQFKTVENLRVARAEEVNGLQNQLDLRRLEIAHLGLEHDRAKQQAQNLIARCSRDEKIINQLKEEIVNLQTETELDRELMSACLTYSEKHQAEYTLLERYCKEDEDKIRDCLFRIDVLTVEENKEKIELEDLEAQVRVVKLELARLQEQTTDVMNERHEKIDHWSKIRCEVQGGEKNLETLQEELDTISAKRAAKIEALQIQKEFHESELRNNEQVEKRLEAMEMNVTRAHDFLTELENKKRELTDQIQMLNNTCASYRRSMKLARKGIMEFSRQIKKVNQDTFKWQQMRVEVGVQNSEVHQKNLSDEERLAVLNRQLDNRESTVREAEQKITQLRELNYKHMQENRDLKAELDEMNVSVHSNVVYLNSLHSQLKNLRLRAHAHARLIYDLQYKITQLVRRISFMEGTDTGPSEKALQELKTLTENKELLTKDIDLMQSRLFRQEEVIKNLKKDVDSNEERRIKHEIALAETMLYLHAAERSIEKVKNRKIETAAELSSSRLKLRYITDKAEIKLDSVTDMAVRQVELDGLFKERIVSVQMEREQIKAQCKRIDEQRSCFVKILRELENQQLGVKRRFELLALPISQDMGQGDATDIVKIQADFFVKAASERQEFKNLKTRLMKEIQDVMQNNYKLRLFLEQFEAQTNCMRNTVYHGKQKPELDQKQQDLDNEMTFLKERLRDHEEQVFGYKDELTILGKTSEKLDFLKEKVQQGIKQDSEELKLLLADCNDQKNRLDRTTNQNSTMYSAIKKVINSEDLQKLLADVEVSIYTDIEKLLLSTIRRCIEKYPSAFSLIEQFFKENNIQMSEELTKALLKRASEDSQSISRSSTARMSIRM